MELSKVFFYTILGPYSLNFSVSPSKFVFNYTARNIFEINEIVWNENKKINGAFFFVAFFSHFHFNFHFRSTAWSVCVWGEYAHGMDCEVVKILLYCDVLCCDVWCSV